MNSKVLTNFLKMFLMNYGVILTDLDARTKSNISARQGFQ